jgi:hypothetical protein
MQISNKENVSIIESSQQSNVQSSQQSGPTNEHNGQVMARIWQRMTEVYGHRWISAWGEGTNPDGTPTRAAQTWAEGLARYSLDEIRQAFEKLVKRGDEWPPTLPEFMRLCREKRAAPYHRMAGPALPSPAVDPVIIREELKKMRGMLGRS